VTTEATDTTVAVDGSDIESQITTQLAYLSRLAKHLGVNDPVEEYFAPVVGRWSDMHAEAERWRAVGEGVEQVTEALNRPLGKLDAAWDGEAANSFIAYMQKVGMAGNDLSDAMIAMGEVLDTTANGIREIVLQLATVMSETAETASGAMALPVQGDSRTRDYLDMMRKPSKELFESVRQILEAFVQLCEGADADDAFAKVTMAHTFPTENWAGPTPPSVPAPATGVPVDTSTDAAGASDLGDLAGFGGGGGGGGGLGGLGGAAAASATPLGPGAYTVAGEQVPASSTPGPSGAPAAAGAPKTAGGSMGGMGMAPMMGGMGAGQGGNQEHKSRSRVVGNPTDIFGKPEKATTPVIGAED